MSHSRLRLDIRGQRFGQLTAVQYAGVRYSPKGSAATYWTCRCECGSRKDYALGNLRGGKSRQCQECAIQKWRKAGCFAGKKHGKSGTPVYVKWCQLRLRSKKKLCQEWRDDFMAFYRSVGDPPSSLHRLYCLEGEIYGPGTAEWLTSVEYRAKVYAKLTGQPYAKVLEHFRNLTRARTYQLLNVARGNCPSCGRTADWHGEDVSCMCIQRQVWRCRLWIDRLIRRLAQEGMSRKEVASVFSISYYQVCSRFRRFGVSNRRSGRPSIPIPEDFVHDISTGKPTADLSQKYAVSANTIYRWINKLKLRQTYRLARKYLKLERYRNDL